MSSRRVDLLRQQSFTGGFRPRSTTPPAFDSQQFLRSRGKPPSKRDNGDATPLLFVGGRGPNGRTLQRSSTLHGREQFFPGGAGRSGLHNSNGNSNGNGNGNTGDGLLVSSLDADDVFADPFGRGGGGGAGRARRGGEHDADIFGDGSDSLSDRAQRHGDAGRMMGGHDIESGRLSPSGFSDDAAVPQSRRHSLDSGANRSPANAIGGGGGGGSGGGGGGGVTDPLVPSSESPDGKDGARRMVRGRFVSLYYLETLFVFLEYLQFVAMFWSVGRTWKWPFWFLDGMEWTLVFSIERWRSYIDPRGGALVVRDVGVGYAAWLLLWCLAPVALYLGYRFFLAMRHLAGSSERHMEQSRARVEIAFLWFAELLYLPWAANALSVFSCADMASDQGDTVRVLTLDPSMRCGSPSHVMTLVVVGAMCALFLVGLPVQLYRRVSLGVSHARPRTHERQLRLAEMEYLLGLSDDWGVHSVHLWSPFRKRLVHWRPLNMISKLAMVSVYWALRPHPATQCLVVLLVLVSVQLLTIPFPVYRRIGTNATFHWSRWTLCVMLLMSHLATAGARSPLLVARSMHFLFVGFNVIVLAAFVLETLVAHKFGIRWPVTKKSVEKLCEEHGHYIKAIEDSRALAAHFRAKESLLFADPTQIATMVERVDAFRRRARRDDLVIEATLTSAMEDLVALYNEARPVSLLPCPALERMLPSFKARLDARDYELLLVPEEKRSIALKLLCVRAFLNGRKVARTPGDPATWPRYDDPYDPGDYVPSVHQTSSAQSLGKGAKQRDTKESRREREVRAKVLREVLGDGSDDEDDMDAYFRNMGVGVSATNSFSSAKPFSFTAAASPEPSGVAGGSSSSPYAVGGAQSSQPDSIGQLSLPPSLVPVGGRNNGSNGGRLDAIAEDDEGDEYETDDEAEQQQQQQQLLQRQKQEAAEKERREREEREARERKEKENEEREARERKEKEEREAREIREREEREAREKKEKEEEEERLLSDPKVVEERLAEATQEKKRLRKEIQAYESAFEKREGRKPTKEDKRSEPQVIEMFKRYKEKSSEVESLKARQSTSTAAESTAAPTTATEPAKSAEPGPSARTDSKKADDDKSNNNNNNDTATTAAGDVDLRTPPPKDGPGIVTFASAGLDQASRTAIGDTASPGDLPPSELLAVLTKVRSNLKKAIKRWESEFTERVGHGPASADKQAIKSWYACASKLKDAIGKLEALG